VVRASRATTGNPVPPRERIPKGCKEDRDSIFHVYLPPYVIIRAKLI
jgi:hypothetical protein